MIYVDFNKLTNRQYKELLKKYKVLIFRVPRQPVVNILDKFTMRFHKMIYLKKQRCHHYTYIIFKGKDFNKIKKIKRSSQCPPLSVGIGMLRLHSSSYDVARAMFKNIFIKVKGMNFEEFQKEYFLNLLKL